MAAITNTRAAEATPLANAVREALYAGQIAPMVLSAVTAGQGAISRERARELIDLALLHFEEAQARMPAILEQLAKDRAAAGG